jgi:hypothetical protein
VKTKAHILGFDRRHFEVLVCGFLANVEGGHGAERAGFGRIRCDLHFNAARPAQRRLVGSRVEDDFVDDVRAVVAEANRDPLASRRKSFARPTIAACILFERVVFSVDQLVGAIGWVIVEDARDIDDLAAIGRGGDVATGRGTRCITGCRRPSPAPVAAWLC